MISRAQALVLGFFAVAWVSVLAILIVAPEIYDQALGLPPGDHRSADLGLLAALSVFLAVLAYGVVRRWRWMFWLIAVAFVFGIARAPASFLQLIGVVPASNPSWYLLFQAAIGLVQFAIGLALLVGYRRRGVWGDF
jgi:hypothetical protein